MRQHNLSGSSTWNSSSMIQDYAENATYDGNGNILSYLRNGNSTTGLPMDNLTYHYNHDASGNLQTNRLRQINDAVPSNNGYTADLKDQSDTANYTYDQIGNLIHDTQAGITNIDWTVYGKIWNIYKGTGNINYNYSPAGQRVSKTYNNITAYYVRDAQGNTIAVYDNSPPPGGGGGGFNWREQHLYGSSRLGIWAPNLNLANAGTDAQWQLAGLKQYELTNHLGNVLATITDRRLQVPDASGTTLGYYTADVATAQDYYPFGMIMPGRTYLSPTGGAGGGYYRYGFNGKENDNEVKGVGNQQDYGMRIYDDRVGRFFSVDPVAKEYPELTPYQFASNSPIAHIDLDGLEKVIYIYNMTGDKVTHTKIELPKAGKLGQGIAVQLIKKDGSVHGFYGSEFKDMIAYLKDNEKNGLQGHAFESYNDVNGNLTVGYGHKFEKTDPMRKLYPVGTKISETKAVELLNQDLKDKRQDANTALKNVSGLNTNELDALTDVFFNLSNANREVKKNFSTTSGSSFFLRYMKGGVYAEKRRLNEAVLYDFSQFLSLDGLTPKQNSYLNNVIKENTTPKPTEVKKDPATGAP